MPRRANPTAPPDPAPRPEGEPAANGVDETADRVHAIDQDPDLECEPAPVRVEALDREREGGLAGTEQTEDERLG